MKYVLTLLTVWASLSAQAQTWPGWRLRSFGLERYDYLSSGFKPADSAVYYYSGNRTGEPSFAWLESILRSPYYRQKLYLAANDLQYDSVHTYRGSIQGSYNFANANWVQHFNGTIITKRTYVSSGSSLGGETYTYINNLLAESVTSYNKLTYVYKSSKLPDTIHYYYFDSPNQSWKHTKTQYYVYDGNQRLQTSRILYTGSAAYDIYHYTYINGLPETIITITGGTQPDDTLETWTYTYTANGELDTELKCSNNIMGNLENWNKHHHTYDNNHNRTQHLIYNWNNGLQQWDTFSKWTYTYTQANLPETFESLNWDSPNQVWAPMQDTNDNRTSHRMRLHYDIVWPVNITEQQRSYATIQLYPNPAGEILTFRIGMKTAQPFTTSITDMQGRTLMQWKEAAAKEYTRTIPTAALPAGTYVLRVDADGLEQTKLFSIR